MTASLSRLSTDNLHTGNTEISLWRSILWYSSQGKEGRRRKNTLKCEVATLPERYCNRIINLILFFILSLNFKVGKKIWVSHLHKKQNYKWGLPFLNISHASDENSTDIVRPGDIPHSRVTFSWGTARFLSAVSSARLEVSEIIPRNVEKSNRQHRRRFRRKIWVSGLI